MHPGHRFQWIADTHSEKPQKVSAIVSETVSAMDRNPRPPSIGIGVRNASEYAPGDADASESDT